MSENSSIGPSAEWDLAELIRPIGVETFGREYWERQPLVVERNDPDFYQRLLTLDAMDQILAGSGLTESEVQMVAAGDRYRGDPGNSQFGPEVLYDQYRNGKTINIVFLHKRWQPLGVLCRSMTEELTAKVQANIYLTPPGQQGFTTHYDTHDVFIAQVHGRKHWRLYGTPIRLPQPGQRWAGDEPGEPVRELDLAAGDLLYLPRGTLHDATSHDGASLHITIGIHPVTWGAIIRDSVEQAILTDARYREALPLRFAHDEAVAAVSRQRVAELTADLARIAPAGPLITDAARGILSGSQPVLRGHLLDLEALPSLTLDTKVRARPGLVWRLTANGETASLEFHGKTVRLPGRVTEELRFATTTDAFTGRDLPGSLDEAGRMVLIKTLVREGFLTVR